MTSLYNSGYLKGLADGKAEEHKAIRATVQEWLESDCWIMKRAGSPNLEARVSERVFAYQRVLDLLGGGE